jgi:hypothetical protein
MVKLLRADAISETSLLNIQEFESYFDLKRHSKQRLTYEGRREHTGNFIANLCQRSTKFLLKQKTPELSGVHFRDLDLFNLVSLSNLVYDVKSFYNLTEYGMLAVKVLGSLSAEANEELSASRIGLPGIGHREYSSVMVLIGPSQFIWNGITQAPSACTCRISSLDDKAGEDSVKSGIVIIATFGQVDKVFHGLWGIFLKK